MILSARSRSLFSCITLRQVSAGCCESDICVMTSDDDGGDDDGGGGGDRRAICVMRAALNIALLKRSPIKQPNRKMRLRRRARAYT